MYSNQLEIDAYRKLKDVDPATDDKYQVDNSSWVFDLNEATQQTITHFGARMPMFKESFGTDPNAYVETFWATPLMEDPGTTCWPRQFVRGLDPMNTLQNPVQSLLFTRLIAMFGSQWDQTCAAGTPVRICNVKQRRPGAVHVRDIVIYRTVKRGLQETGLKMNIVTDPMMGLDILPGSRVIDPKKLSFCANAKCLALDRKSVKCGGCKVSKTLYATTQLRGTTLKNLLSPFRSHTIATATVKKQIG